MNCDANNELCGILQLIEQNIDANVSSEIITDILEKMREFSSSQFPIEEAQMAELDYPNLPCHKQAHKDFLQTVSELCVYAEHHKESVPKDIQKFLSKWRTEHINSSDRHFKFFKENNSLLQKLM